MNADRKQLGEDRQSFMDRVRRALERTDTAAPVEGPPPVSDIARLTGPGEDLVSVFTERAEAVGMQVHRVETGAAVEEILRILHRLKAERIAVGAGAIGRRLVLDEAIRASGRMVVDWAKESVEAQYATDVGITDTEAGFAETGTLVCCGGPGQIRCLSLVPPTHLAILRRSDILPDMIDYWLRYESGGPIAGSIVFITGPSKTGDIEGRLVHGVHGPAQVHVVLLEDM